MFCFDWHHWGAEIRYKIHKVVKQETRRDWLLLKDFVRKQQLITLETNNKINVQMDIIICKGLSFLS